MKERSALITWLRGELVGPSQPLSDPRIAAFQEKVYRDSDGYPSGPVRWVPPEASEPQEVLYFEGETPFKKYGIGLLHPLDLSGAPPPDQAALEAADRGVETGEDGTSSENDVGNGSATDEATDADDFDVTSPDFRRPSTLGISFCIELEENGLVEIALPRHRLFHWQEEGAAPFQVNGRYESCRRRWNDDSGNERQAIAWRRTPTVADVAHVQFRASDFKHSKVLGEDVPTLAGCPIKLKFELFPRKLGSNRWLCTVVLRNATDIRQLQVENEGILFQTHFDVSTRHGKFVRYPESRRSFDSLDEDEQSLLLLYSDSATWAIGHGCAAGWDGDQGTPSVIFCDVLPAVELPSMTPDIELDGTPLSLSMRALSELPEDLASGAWITLDRLPQAYEDWLDGQRKEATRLNVALREVASRHLAGCEECLERIKRGIQLLRSNSDIRKAFRLTNLSMLLQQISNKHLKKRPLEWGEQEGRVRPQGTFVSPWQVYESQSEGDRLGHWRAFQIGFLLMSLDGVASHKSEERDLVDLIWFPTGGGKTEAYLAVIAFLLVHERLLMAKENGELRRDGTNVFMRYTLRMLTTQQFQRAASLITALEFIRRTGRLGNDEKRYGKRFSLGLWIGGSGSPNSIREAKSEVGKFRRNDLTGNPLVLTECPWCKAEIGRYGGSLPKKYGNKSTANQLRIAGIYDLGEDGPVLLCPDSSCDFGKEDPAHWLPVEVIDERIYADPPSFIIGTADKLAIVTYRPNAGILFGLQHQGNGSVRVYRPPSLIVQDELHLISGPLGTMYALYEGIVEKLCTVSDASGIQKPKIIASTATIRGATDQVISVYGRSETRLFPCPSLKMSDSFFGRYARETSGKLKSGRLYLGIHASDYGSVLTTQVRTFSSVLFRAWCFDSDEQKDPWWTLLVFYNSIRELGGARTLFDSDIRSRLKLLFNREGFPLDKRRHLLPVEELTSRLSQAEIVTMMDRLATPKSSSTKALDACLASNIIEVGVDIDRLSVMGIVGQPKTTSSYIQVSGRVGRRWDQRPGLILMVYNPGKSRDRSHFEQFHSYHRRLYERVEPTSATPFALSALQRGLCGALLMHVRQFVDEDVWNFTAHERALDDAAEIVRARCESILEMLDDDPARALCEIDRLIAKLKAKWKLNPQEWESFPQVISGEYLMLWPGQFATPLQQERGVIAPSSMRQVDSSGELEITQGYAISTTQNH